jgi:subtilase family serine protease
MLALLLSFAVLSAAPSPRNNSVGTFQQLCGPPSIGAAACAGEMLTDSSGHAVTTATPTGLKPADFQSAYNLPSSTNGTGQTVAIVDAYDDPKAESDLAVYRSTFGLSACTTANGCFTKVDQWGGTNFPVANKGWAGEIAFDVDMVSAVCPNCHILLVETASPGLKSLGAGVDIAARLHATEISNSYARSEFPGETAYDTHYDHPGIMITVASGNGTYAAGATYPAASPYVTAVGGTKLTRAKNARGWTETVWSKTSSGCSLYEPKPAWQHDSRCANRTVADTAAVAVNIATYFTYGGGAWGVGYGTSAPTPMIAGIYALQGNAALLTFGSSTYQGGGLFDITTGSTGSCGNYLCQGASGYDGPTGNGTPDGTAAY